MRTYSIFLYSTCTCVGGEVIAYEDARRGVLPTAKRGEAIMRYCSDHSLIQKRGLSISPRGVEPVSSTP